MQSKLEALQGLWHEKAPHLLPAVQVFVPSNKLQLRKRPPSVRIPSDFGSNGVAYCMREWTTRNCTVSELVRWAEDDRLGFGIRCGYVRAIDIDIEDEDVVNVVYKVANETSRNLQRGSKLSPQPFAIRRRTNSKRCALLCKTTHFEAEAFSKVVVKLPGDEKIEFLGNSQYIALWGQRFDDVGEYDSEYFFQRFGTDYDADLEEKGKYPTLEQLPVLSNDDILFIADKIRQELEVRFDQAVGLSEDFASSQYPRGFGADEITELGNNQLAILEAADQVYKSGSTKDARWYVKCPWEHTHTSVNGERDAMFIPDRVKAGVNFNASFKCFHAHCEGKTIDNYVEEIDLPLRKIKELNVEAAALGVKSDELDNCVTTDLLVNSFNFLSHSQAFELIRLFASPIRSDFCVQKVLSGIDNPYAYRRQTRNEIVARKSATDKLVDKSKKKLSANALMNTVVNCNIFKYDLSYDLFMNEVKIRKFDDVSCWEKLQDKHITMLKVALNRIGFPDPSTGTLREVITTVSEANTSDCAVDWLDSLEWDGISRLEEFIEKGFGIHCDEYLFALSEFIWTALAGRLLKPGCKVDMIPIFIGAQGIRKSTFVKKIAPFENWYTTTSLDVHDADIARRTAGRCVVELPELSGLKTRALESIKAWVTLQEDTWVPKYKEHSYTVARRWIAFGTGNDMRLFTDSTGNRRWLPIDMRDSTGLDVKWLLENREQLWAEGRVKFVESGVAYDVVEKLAGNKRDNFKPKDIWYVPAKSFYETYGRIPTVNELFSICLQTPLANVAPHQVTRADNMLAMLKAEVMGEDSERIVQESFINAAPAAHEVLPAELPKELTWEF